MKLRNLPGYNAQVRTPVGQSQRIMFSWFGHKTGSAGPPVRRERIGSLRVLSGTVLIGDPRFWVPVLTLTRVIKGEHEVHGYFVKYPVSGKRLAAIEITFMPPADSPLERLDPVQIDSGCLVILDQRSHDEHWVWEGIGRVGVLRSPENKRIGQLLQKRFGLAFKPVHERRAELVQRISEEMEQQIIDYLRSQPGFAGRVSSLFGIETNTTEDRLRAALDVQSHCQLTLDPLSRANVIGVVPGAGNGHFLAAGNWENHRPAKVVVQFIDRELPHLALPRGEHHPGR